MYKIVDDIDYEIVNETNNDVKNIENDVKALSEIMIDLSHLIHTQEESIKISSHNIEHAKMEIEETTISLEKSLMYSKDRKGIIKNAALIVGGISLGALGFIAGPFIGIGTLVAGAVTGSGITFFT